MENPKIKINQNAALGIAALGVFLFATKAILVKLAYKEHINAQTMLLLRMSFSVPVYLCILLLPQNFSKIKSLSLKEHLMIISLGIVGYFLSSLFDFVGLQYITANLERLILFAYPTMVVLISSFILKKKISKAQWYAIIITYIGIFITLFEKIQFQNSSLELYGILLIFASALTYALYLIGSGELLTKIGTVPFTAYAMVISSVFVIIYAQFTSTTPLQLIPQNVYFIGIIMAIFATIIPSFLISYAIKNANASSVSIIGSIGPVFTILLSYFILNESMSIFQIIGGIIILLGVYWVSLKK